MSDIAKIILERYGSKGKEEEKEEKPSFPPDLENVIKDFFEAGQSGKYKEAAECFMVLCEMCEDEEDY